MTISKFVVRVNRSGSRVPEYVQQIDRTPIRTTKNRKLAMVMGRFTAEDVVDSLQHSRCSPELVPVEVHAYALVPTQRDPNEAIIVDSGDGNAKG